MLPLGRVCKQPMRSLTRICQNSKFKIKGRKGKLTKVLKGLKDLKVPKGPIRPKRRRY